MMLYPSDAMADPMTYETSGDTFELIKYGNKKKNNVSFTVFSTYEFSKDTKYTETQLYLLSS